MATIGRRQSRRFLEERSTPFLGGINTNTDRMMHTRYESNEIKNYEITSSGTLIPRKGLLELSDVSSWIDSFDNIITFRIYEDNITYDGEGEIENTTLYSKITSDGTYQLRDNINNYDLLTFKINGEEIFVLPNEVTRDIRGTQIRFTTNGDVVIIKDVEEISYIKGIKYLTDTGEISSDKGFSIHEIVVYEDAGKTYLSSRIKQNVSGEIVEYKPGNRYLLSSEVLNHEDIYIEHDKYFVVNVPDKILVSEVRLVDGNVEVKLNDITSGENSGYYKPPDLNEVNVFGFNLLSPDGDIDISDKKGTVVNIDGIHITGTNVGNKRPPFGTGEDIKLNAVTTFTEITPLEKLAYKWSYDYFQTKEEKVRGNIKSGSVDINETYEPQNKEIIFRPTKSGYYRFFVTALRRDVVINRNIEVDFSKVKSQEIGTYPVEFTVKDANGNSATVTGQLKVVEGNPGAPGTIIESDEGNIKISCFGTAEVQKGRINESKIFKLFEPQAIGMEDDEKFILTTQRALTDAEVSRKEDGVRDELIEFNSLRSGNLIKKWKNFYIYLTNSESSFNDTIYFSLPSNPAYVPQTFKVQMPEQVIDIEPHTSFLIVATSENIYRITGDVPRSISNNLGGVEGAIPFTYEKLIDNVGVRNKNNMMSGEDGIMLANKNNIYKFWFSNYVSTSPMRLNQIGDYVSNILPDKFDFVGRESKFMYFVKGKKILVIEHIGFSETLGRSERFYTYEFSNDIVNMQNFKGDLLIMTKSGNLCIFDESSRGYDLGEKFEKTVRVNYNYPISKEQEKVFQIVNLTINPIRKEEVENGIGSLEMYVDGSSILNAKEAEFIYETGEYELKAKDNIRIDTHRFILSDDNEEFGTSMPANFTLIEGDIITDDVDVNYSTSIPVNTKGRGFAWEFITKDNFNIKDYTLFYKTNKAKRKGNLGKLKI